jgi:hypothetical protein
LDAVYYTDTFGYTGAVTHFLAEQYAAPVLDPTAQQHIAANQHQHTAADINQDAGLYQYADTDPDLDASLSL